MANKRKTLPISNYSDDLKKQLHKTYNQMDHMIISIHEEAKKVQEEYWSKVKEIVNKIYAQNKLSIVKRSGSDLRAMTFVVYSPIIKLETKDNSNALSLYWGIAKYGHKTTNDNGKTEIKRKNDHVKMKKAPSPYMPGRYESTQFKFNAHNLWQREIVLDIEEKLAELRTITFKLNLSYNDLKDVLKVSSKHKSVENAAPLTEFEFLVELRDALHEFGMDPNRLTKDQGQLLMNTSNDVLIRFGINPEIKDCYFC